MLSKFSNHGQINTLNRIPYNSNIPNIPLNLCHVFFFLRNGHNVHTRHGFARWLRRSIRYPLDASRKELLRFTALGNSSGSLYLRMAAALCFFEEQKNRTRGEIRWFRWLDFYRKAGDSRHGSHQQKAERCFQQIVSKLDSSWSFFPELLGRWLIYCTISFR